MFAGLKVEKPRFARKTTYKVNDILKAVQAITHVPIKDIKSKSRERQRTDARHLLSYFLRRYTYLSFAKIGSITNRDHSSVIHSKKTIEEGLFYDNEVTRIENVLRGRKDPDNDIAKIVRESVVDVTGIEFKILYSKVRVRTVCDARALLVYFLKKRTNYSIWQISAIVNRSYSFVYDTNLRVLNICDIDEYFIDNIEKINELIDERMATN